jgi:DNA-binding transcriptional regulator LsrR (DeoR family)
VEIRTTAKRIKRLRYVDGLTYAAIAETMQIPYLYVNNVLNWRCWRDA